MSLRKEIEKTFSEEVIMPIEIGIMLDFIENNMNESDYFQIDIQFKPINQEIIRYYFNNEEIGKYFGVLALTADGSLLSIWKDSDQQRFIHLGCEGDNWLILASNPIDFIRVIAIGYDAFEKNKVIHPPIRSRIDKSFQDWVRKTFSVEIPKSGNEIIDLKSEKLITWIEC